VTLRNRRLERETRAFKYLLAAAKPPDAVGRTQFTRRPQLNFTPKWGSTLGSCLSLPCAKRRREKGTGRTTGQYHLFFGSQ
jgi:hypothetical protein